METYATISAVRAANDEGEILCPECEQEGPHADNGGRGVHLSFCCSECGTHFDAESFLADDPTTFEGRLRY
jgi:transposase-like protein